MVPDPVWCLHIRLLLKRRLLVWLKRNRSHPYHGQSPVQAKSIAVQKQPTSTLLVRSSLAGRANQNHPAQKKTVNWFQKKIYTVFNFNKYKITGEQKWKKNLCQGQLENINLIKNKKIQSKRRRKNLKIKFFAELLS